MVSFVLDLAQLFEAAPVAGKSFQSLRRNMTFHVVVERFVAFEDRPLKLVHESPRQPSLREDRNQGLAGVALDVHGGNDPLARAGRGQANPERRAGGPATGQALCGLP